MKPRKNPTSQTKRFFSKFLLQHAKRIFPQKMTLSFDRKLHFRVANVVRLLFSLKSSVNNRPESVAAFHFHIIKIFAFRYVNMPVSAAVVRTVGPRTSEIIVISEFYDMHKTAFLSKGFLSDNTNL